MIGFASLKILKSNGTPRVHQDGINQLRYDYSYDSIGRLIRTDMSNSTNGTSVGSTEYGYNTRGHLISVSNEIGGNAYSQYYSYSDTGVEGALANAKDGLPTRYTALGTNTDYSYDSLNRLTLRSVKVSDSFNLNNYYSYMTTNRNEEGKSYATTRLGTETIVGVPYSYSYDEMGNITAINCNDAEYRSYTYDALGEMRSETQHTLNRKTNYVYDALGNITSKTTINTTTNANVSKVTYNYSKDSDAGWNYLLTSLTFTDYTNSNNNRTETIDYDAIGNPLSYRGATMSWFGRQMRTYNKGNISANFTYDADGLRSAKAVNGIKTTYQYVGDQLFYEKIGENKTLYYFYDSYGNLSQIYYTFGTGEDASTARYFVTTNAQGDVIGLYNSNGVKVGAYDYDAWGNTRMFVVTQDANGKNVHTQIDPETQYLNHIVNVNPIRYRGYYYDSDLDLYYLQSRYYDSEIGRFINADSLLSQDSVLGYNVFAYCLNSPVNMSDPSGHLPKWLSGVLNVVSGISQMLVGAALGATVSWTGVGAVAAGFLIANGAATATQGVGQIVNSVTNSNVLREDNMIRTGVVSAGRTIAGDFGGGAAGLLYDSAVIVAGIYAASGPKTPCACFVAGTAILTGLGSRFIEDIRAGDLVWSENPETGEKSLKRVVQTFVRESDELVHVFVNGEEILTTPEHPFYVPQKGWVGSIQLRAGDILVLQNGNYVIVEKVQHEILEEPITVYNFEVEDFHTYYVGNGSILVHNTCGGPKNQMTFPTRKQAFNAAKRELGIPRSQQPIRVGPNIDKRGNIVPGRVYDFGDGLYIRDDVAGHLFPDGGSIGRHFNTSNEVIHYFY